MNVRRGMRRVARVTAIAYGVTAMLVVAVTFSDALARTVYAPSWTVTAAPGDWRYSVRAYTEAEAQEIANSVRANPKNSGPTYPGEVMAVDYQPEPLRENSLWQAIVEALKMAAGWSAVYVGLLIMFRAARWIALGFAEDKNAPSA